MKHILKKPIKKFFSNHYRYPNLWPSFSEFNFFSILDVIFFLNLSDIPTDIYRYLTQTFYDQAIILLISTIASSFSGFTWIKGLKKVCISKIPPSAVSTKTPGNNNAMFALCYSNNKAGKLANSKFITEIEIK